jgi:hypothetical protein
MLRWVIFIAIYLALGLYALQALKTVSRYPWVYYTFIFLSLLVLGNFVYQFTIGDDTGRVLNRPKSYAFGLLLTMLTFKLITIIFLFSEDIFRILSGGYQKMFGTAREFGYGDCSHSL